MYSEYSEKDIKSILDEKLDIMLRGNVANIYRGKVLKLAKYGIISFHHGDSSWNRGGPPGFWEVVFKKPSKYCWGKLVVLSAISNLLFSALVGRGIKRRFKCLTQ